MASPSSSHADESEIRREEAPQTVSAGGLFLSLSSASLVMLSAGTAYLFSLYAPQLATSLHLSQSQTAFVGACGNSGIYISGPFFGSQVDKHRNTPAAFFLFGGACIFFGYAILGAADGGRISPPHFLILASIFLLIGIGSAACYHCALATNYRNWPVNLRGIAVGIPVGFFGLSAFLFAGISSILFMKTAQENPQNILEKNLILDVPNFLLFLGAICLLINCYAAMTLHDQSYIPTEQIQDENNSISSNNSLNGNSEENGNPISFPNSEQHASETTPLLANNQSNQLVPQNTNYDAASSPSNCSESSWLSAQSITPFRPRGSSVGVTHIDDNQGFENIGNDDPSTIVRMDDAQSPRSAISHQTISIRNSHPSSPQRSSISNAEHVAIQIDDISCFLFLDAYILAYLMFTIVGIGLAYINNVGAILVALSSADEGGVANPVVQHAQKTHVGLLSLVGFGSRIIVGLVSDLMHHRFAVPRTAWSFVSALFMTAAICIMCVATSFENVLVASTLVGIAYGAVWTITPVLIGEYFGYHRFGQNWGTMTIVPAFGGQLFSFLLGLVFDAASSGRSGLESFLQGNQHVCHGANCFQPFFRYAFWVSVSAIAATIILYIRRRSV